MKSYTEKEIQDWFEMVIAKFGYAPMADHARAIRDLMFNEFWDSDNLKNFQNPLTESK